MTRTKQVFILLIMLISVATAQSGSSDAAALKATFAASNGRLIKLNFETGTLVTPLSHSKRLEDCGDKFQVCITDHHGLAFAYFRKCNDATIGDYKRLRFPPKVVSALGNNDVWMVFDAGPKYLFHYAYGKGIVGVYLGPTASYDFRSVLHDQSFSVGDLDQKEYKITASSGAIAPCRE
jgi:hypothetical protein